MNIRTTVTVLLLALCATAGAEDVKITFKVKVPATTPKDAKVYLSGNLKPLGEWSGAGAELKLDKNDATYTAAITLPKDAQVEYKVTRGSWDTVEKNKDGSELANRTLTPTRDATVEIEVAAWADQSASKEPQKKSTRTGDIRTHPFHSRHLNNDRKLWIYLPPNYEIDRSTRYPVFYLQDGQNLFDAATSFAGEWHADETAQSLIEQKKIQPLIVVGIENTKDRIAEYTPVADTSHPGGGQGNLYARFLIEEVKPFIDHTYRTLTDRDQTAIGGSSLGALISLHIAATHPDTFSRVAAISPAIWWADRNILKTLDTDALKHTKIWLDIGTRESMGPEASQSVADLRAAAEILHKHGVDHTLQIIDNAPHNESAWSARFGQVLTFLFPA